MDAKEINKTILEAKRFIQQHSPPKEETTDEFLKKAKLRTRRLRNYLDEQEGSDRWIENGEVCTCPPGLYLNKEGNFIRKNLWTYPQ